MVAGIELKSIAEKPGKGAFDCFIQCYEKGLLIRTTGDIIALSPLIIEKEHIDRIVEILTGVLQEIKWDLTNREGAYDAKEEKEEDK